MDGHTPRDGASRWLDRMLAALGLALFIAALVWMTCLIRDNASLPEPQQPGAAAVAPVDDAAVPLLEDDAFGIALPGLALRRVVQMLQWREVASIPLGVDDEVVDDQGEYQLVWSERLIDSSSFATASGHVNPPAPPFRSQSLGPERSAWTDTQAGAWRAVPPQQVELPENLAAVFRADGAWLVTMADAAPPELGDLRVRFEVLPSITPALPAMAQDVPAADVPLDQALRWIARVAAFVMAMLGAALALRGFSRLSPAGGKLASLHPAALLAASAWIAVAAALVAAGISRLI